MDTQLTTVRNILTRTTGYLRTVTSHSAQPYRGCAFGASLCGVGCYVRHNHYVTQGREWGRFLEARENAASSYRENVERERRWAHRRGTPFGIFLSSSTEPFLPQESRLGITRALLDAMRASPPDRLIVQTHSTSISDAIDELTGLSRLTDLRVHLSIETDRESVPGLPPHACSVENRFEAAARVRAAGLRTIITVSPLLPIDDPERFFKRIAETADAVVLDHFVRGDGSPDGSRTRRTPLPLAMERIAPGSISLDYLDAMVELAERILPGRVGVSMDGFAGRYRPRSAGSEAL